MVYEDFIDTNGPLGVLYEKRGEGVGPLWHFPDVTIFMPRCSSTFQIRVPAEKNSRLLDAYSFVVIPAGMDFQVSGMTSIADSVLFIASKELMENVSSLYAVDVVARLRSLLSVDILSRTNWMNEIMHRYVYERAVARNANNNATRFLEQEIVKEVYYRLEEHAQLDKSRFDLDSLATDLRSPLLRAAMAFVDANLFKDITVTDIARHVGASESTVLREFQTRLKFSPAVYIMNRRLDEAMMLIKTQRYAIGQVSDIIGYENVSAFSAAFKKRFGMTPTQVVTKKL